jgi:hypothetical protein
MEIYADPRARARARTPRDLDGPRRTARTAAGPGHPPRRIPPAPAGLWSVQTSLHGARSAHSRPERRRQVASFDGDAAGARGHLSVASSVVPRGGRAGRSEQMRITSHTYIHNLSGNDYPHRSIAYEQSLRRIRPRLHCQRPSHLVSESAELFHLVMIHGNCS